ncbi:hypothetical protein C8T65DRAFT_697708 [Cerioporus squamosus]|nr:hypothetical protein C8T65DRAFT_697708 [Cerioporus squamosus]
MTNGGNREYISCDSRSQRKDTNQPPGDIQQTEAWALAWWKDCRKVHSHEEGRDEMVHVYKTHVKPSQPLVVGKRARIFAMPRFAPTTPGAILRDHKAYDPHIAGIVEEITAMEEGWAKVTIRNLCRGNAIRSVELDIIHAPGETVQSERLPEIPSRHGWTLEEIPPECVAHLGRQRPCGVRGKDGRLDLLDEHGGLNGSVDRRVFLARREDKERDGSRRWSGNGAPYGQETCGAEECGLEPRAGQAESGAGRPWKVMETRVKREEPRQGLDGVLKLHLWLRYEWAK